MTERRSPSPISPTPGPGQAPTAAIPQTIHIHHHPPRGGWLVRLVLGLLLVSVILNLTQLASFRDYQSGSRPPYERFHSGVSSSSDKIALIEVKGVIMPPFSQHTIDTIKKVAEDDSVKGVVLSIDSPGGLVADSHRIYQQLVKLREKKPIIVTMGRMAASGGYYIAMGAGPEATILAEETTWTGSIGVIIPRYNLSEFGKMFGVESDPLKTGPLKDALDPLKPLSPEERKVWETIITESLDEFVRVIDEGRAPLNEDEIRQLVTGQVFTSSQALKLKLVDEIGDQDLAIEKLQEQLGLSSARVVQYERPVSLAESLLGVQAGSLAPQPDPLSRLLEAGVPRAMYLFGWQSGLATP